MRAFLAIGLGLAVTHFSATEAVYGQQVTQQPAGVQRSRPVNAAVNAAATRAPGQPDWYPLAPEHAEYLDKILKYWEFEASKIQHYRCKFTRWEYDPVSLPQHPDVATTVAEGNIQYQAPDKGKFQVEKLWDVAIEQRGNVRVPVLGEDGLPKWVVRQEVLDDHWVCDGQSIFQFDGRNKQIIKRPLPPNMQGKQIADGPLPFLFGAKAETLHQRYWIHVLPPPAKEVFLLEAVPKRQEEAADFRAIHVIIDEGEWLPKVLILYDRAGGRTTFEFTNREKNWKMLPQFMTPWRELFYEPKPPAGWKIVEEPLQGGAAQPPIAAVPSPSAPSRQAAQRPATAPIRK